MALAFLGAIFLFGGAVITLVVHHSDTGLRWYGRFLIVAGLVFVILPLTWGCSLKGAQIAHPILQGADLVSTHVAESRGAVEVNPLMQAGWPTRIALKSAVTVGVLYLTQKIGREHKTLATTVLTVINVVYAGVIVNNLLVTR